MYATLRRYEGIDKVHCDEVTRRVGERLAPPPPRTTSRSWRSPRTSKAQDKRTHQRPMEDPLRDVHTDLPAAW
jgi:hypothetical protein